MDSTLALNNACRDAHSSAQLLRRLTVLVAVTLVVSIAVAGGVFGVRRLAGGAIAPLPAAALVLCGLCLAATVAILRLASSSIASGVSPLGRLVVSAIVPTCLVLFIAAVLSLPGSSSWGLVGLWGIAAAGVVFSHRAGIARRIQSPPEARLTLATEPMVQRDVWQRFTRLRESDGTEVVEGWSRADLPAGARTKQIHIAFCPPFTHTPEVEAEADRGPPTTITMGPVFPHGAQIDIRLDRPPTEATSVVVAISVREGPAKP